MKKTVLFILLFCVIVCLGSSTPAYAKKQSEPSLGNIALIVWSTGKIHYNYYRAKKGFGGIWGDVNGGVYQYTDPSDMSEETLKDLENEKLINSHLEDFDYLTILVENFKASVGPRYKNITKVIYLPLDSEKFKPVDKTFYNETGKFYREKNPVLYDYTSLTKEEIDTVVEIQPAAGLTATTEFSKKLKAMIHASVSVFDIKNKAATTMRWRWEDFSKGLNHLGWIADNSAAIKQKFPDIAAGLGKTMGSKFK